MPMLWAAVLVLPALGDPAGVVFTSLYSFTGANDGAFPGGALVQGSDGYFYGTTEFGGFTNQSVIGCGTVFKISPNGVLTTLYSFTGSNDGENPVGALVQGGDGYFYGATQTALGGPYHGPEYGTVFKISTNGVLTNLYSFSGTNDGAYPAAGLVQGSDGFFYGTTQNGGASETIQNPGYGTVFKISSNGWLTNLYSFSSSNGYPSTSLVQGGDGFFYGTAGGINEGLGLTGYGTVFKIDTNGMLTNLYSFTGTADGESPRGLAPGNDGNFYGTTDGGGAYTNQFGYGNGTVFRFSANGLLTNLYSFTGTNDGAVPQGGLVQGSDSYLYGTTANGGAYTNEYGVGDGTVFRISTNGALTVLHAFGSVLGTNGVPLDGNESLSGLVQGGDGSFYGVTSGGGTNNQGTVFRLTILPAFQTVTLTNGALTLTWSVEAGATYQLQYNLSDLGPGNWINQGTPVIATGTTLSFTDHDTSELNKAYRVKLLPPP